MKLAFVNDEEQRYVVGQLAEALDLLDVCPDRLSEIVRDMKLPVPIPKDIKCGSIGDGSCRECCREAVRRWMEALGC